MDHYYLAHHGIKGQKWGVRRFQNEDGSLTSSGKKRYLKNMKEAGRKYREDLKRGATERLNKAASAAQAHRREIAVAAGVTAAGIALAAYGNHRHVVNAARQEAYARYREQKGEEIARGLLADAMNNPNIVSFENAAGSFHR